MAVLRRGCGCPSRVRVPGVGRLSLRRLSLRFTTAGAEAGFLFHCNERLRRVWLRILLACIAFNSYWLLFPWFDLHGYISEANPIIITIVAMRLGWLLLALVHIVLILVPRLLRPISLVMQERAVLLMLLYTKVCIINRFYIAKLFGHPDPLAVFPETEGFTDSYLLLCFTTLLIVSHVHLPVRWFLLVITEVGTLVVYGIMCYVLGSPEVAKNATFGQLFVLVLVISIGKRQAEANERLIFSALLSEKRLRVLAEFRLSQATTPTGASSSAGAEASDEASCTPTTATGEAFTSLSTDAVGGFRPALETIWEIGKKEAWLIDEDELVVDPHTCLGVGGFGVVAAGEFHGSPAALKFHHRSGSAMPLCDVGNELRLLRKLRHPNIVILHGACLNLEDNDLVLVLERAPGEPMPSFIASEPSAAERWKSMIDVNLALRYLHSRRPPLVHGDLKPENLIVERRGGPNVHAKLLDFGLARVLTRSATPGGGSYRWMAPGALRRHGPPALADDIFALGLTLFFASVGRKPFEGLNERMLKTIVHGYGGAHPALDWPAGEATELVAHCRPVVDTCLRVPREDRPSARAVHEMLQGFGRRGGAGREAEAAGDDGATGSDDPAGSSSCPATAPSALWHTVSVMRRAARKKRGAQTSARAAVSEAQGQEETGRASAEEPGGAEDAAPPAPTALRFPGLQPTPTRSMHSDILEAALLWNYPSTGENSCCDYHASLAFLRTLCADLLADVCKEVQFTTVDILQCPACLRLRFMDKDDDTEFECNVCDYTGPPVAHS